MVTSTSWAVKERLAAHTSLDPYVLMMPCCYPITTQGRSCRRDSIGAMPKPDLPNYSLPMRIAVGIIAVWLIYWLLTTTGTI